MKTMKRILMGLATAVGISTAAMAAAPVAVWDGDFSKTISGYTLNLNGNTEEDGVITIDQTQGVKVDWTTAMTSGMTVLFKYSNLTLGSQQAIATSCINSDGTGDRTGVYLDANNLSHGIWANTSTHDKSATTQGSMTDAQLSGIFALTYKGGSGTYLYCVADGTCTCIHGNSTLMSGNDKNIYGCTVGGTRGTTFAAASGLQISAIAIFNRVLSTDEIANFKWPSERPTYKSVLSLNFGKDSYNVAADTDPYAIVGDSNWYNLNGNNITDAQAGDAFVSYGGGGLYQNGGKAQKFLQSYLDDGSTVNISITNLTGVAYDVYIYCSSDNADGWPYKAVNGADYYALANGETTLGTESWGNNSALDSVLGSNVMVIRGVAPGENGSITIASTRNGSKRGCIAAIQLGEVEKVVPKEFSLDLNEDAAWQSAGWNPELPEEGMSPDATATVTATGNSELTLDGTITVGKLKIVSGEGDMLTIKKAEDANTSFGMLDVSEAADGITLNAKDGFTACSALLTAARTVDNKFYFLGDGDNGALLDYGTAQNNYTFSGHYIFDGGTHTFQNCSESQKLLFAANATEDNPTFWVQNGATLNFKSHNPCGWNAAASNDGIVRIGEESKVVAQNSASGTWYWSQQFYFEDGATLEIDTTGDNFRLVGGADETKPQLYLEAGDATISSTAADKYLAVAKENNPGAGVKVDDGTLTIDAPMKTIANGVAFAKYGEGALKLAGDVSAFSAAIQVKAGTFELASETALGASATIAVEEDATLKIDVYEDGKFTTAVSGSGAVEINAADIASSYTVGVTAGQFDDNIVSYTEGSKLQFTVTSAEAKAGVVLCKAEEDISANITVVNEVGQEITGNFEFDGENSILKFRADCVDFVTTIDGDANWSDISDDWMDSPESTITITNATEDASAVLTFDVEEIVAKSIKIVSEAGKATVISYADFENLTILSYDFSEALGGVQIDFEGAEEGEIQLLSYVTITGSENVSAINTPDDYGLYAGAANIWLCKNAETTFANPVTGDEKTIEYTFFGTNDEDSNWADITQWRKASGGVWGPDTDGKVPGVPGGVYPYMVLDGSLAADPLVTAETLEGWDLGLAVLNGIQLEVKTLNKFQSNTVGKMFLWVDDSSSITFNQWGTGNSAGDIAFAVAAEDGITFNMPFDKAGVTVDYCMTEGASVKYAQGISGGKHNLTNGTLKVEGDGITLGKLNVFEEATVITPALAAVNIAEGATLTLVAPEEGDLVIGGSILKPWVNAGTLNVTQGTVVFMPGVTPGEYTEDGGRVIFGQLVTINDCGKVAVTGATAEDVRLFDEGGNPIKVTKVEGGYAFYDWEITDGACWWDYEFNGDLTSTGSDTTTMTAEGTTPYYNEDETALRVGYGTPWRNASYPEEFTAVIYGKMVNNQGHLEIGFGSTTSGTKKGVVIACGDPSKDEVNLHVTSGYGIVTTIPMTVTDPYDTDHLYAFTCQTINDGGTDKTRVSVYVDGKFLQAYTFDSKITLGGGFQVGSIHGGSLSGSIKATTDNDHADLDFLRVYKTVLNAEAMAKYAEKYPFTSKAGKSERTFTAAAEDWVVEAGTPWTVTPFEEEPTSANAALAGSAVTIATEGSEEPVVTMNLTEATTYESLTIDEGQCLLTIRAGGVEPTITGTTVVKLDTVVDYNAIKFGNIEISADLTFDFTDFPFDKYYSDATIPFTGAVSGSGNIGSKIPLFIGPRTATFEKNPSTDQYELKITVDTTIPFVCSVSLEGSIEWQWAGQTVDEATVDANPVIPIYKINLGTLEKELADNRSYEVNQGIFCVTNASNKHATIKIDDNATCDFNGCGDGYVNVILDGGKLANNGDEIGTGSREIDGITLTADSSVGGTGNFGLISAGYAANTLDLGGFKLTKEDENTFWLCNTTVTNGELYVSRGAIKVVNGTVAFTNDATLNLYLDTTLDVASTLNIDTINSVGGTINNTGTISPFTLTGGAATFTGNGTWGTNTLDGVTVEVGNLRNLAFLGSGSIGVQLTAEEYAAYAPITVFTSEDATVEIGTVTDADGTKLVKGTHYTVDGGKVTPIDTRIAVDSVTLDITATNVTVGTEFQLTETVLPVGATVVSTIWSSDSEGVATVEDGLVTAVAAGTAVISVKVTDHKGTEVTATCNVTVSEPSSGPEWIDPSDTTNMEKYNTWADNYGVTDPSTAKQDAFLLNCDNTDEAIAAAKKEFTLNITFDASGNPVVTSPEGYNGTVKVWGKAALTDADWHYPKTEGDQFFQATLELIPGN